MLNNEKVIKAKLKYIGEIQPNKVNKDFSDCLKMLEKIEALKYKKVNDYEEKNI